MTHKRFVGSGSELQLLVQFAKWSIFSLKWDLKCKLIMLFWCYNQYCMHWQSQNLLEFPVWHLRLQQADFRVPVNFLHVMTKKTVMASCSNDFYIFCSVRKKGCQDFLTSKYGSFNEKHWSKVSHIRVSEMDSILTSCHRLAGSGFWLFIILARCLRAVSSSTTKLFFCLHKDLGQNEKNSQHCYHYSYL